MAPGGPAARGVPQDDRGLAVGRFSDELRRRGRSFFTNWHGYDGTLSEKVRLTLKNRTRALRHGCCGHPGEPGC